MSETDNRDAVDLVVDAWARERPDLDLGAIADIGRLGRVATLLASAQQRVFDGHDLQRGEFDVLATLRRAGAPYALTPTALAASLLLSKAGMTARLDRLVTAGLVDRRADNDNRRSYLAQLSARGLATIDAAMTEHVANVTRLLVPLSRAQRQQLDVILRTMLTSLTRATPAPTQSKRR